MGMIEPWVMAQPLGLGLFQTTSPVLQSSASQQGVAAGGQDGPAVLDQRTLPGVPLRHGGPELPHQIQQPVDRAGRRVDASHRTWGPA